MIETKTSYQLVARHSNSPYPLLVFDTKGDPHWPLTLFASYAVGQKTASTVKIYLYALLPYFGFLDEDIWQVRSGVRWDSEPDKVRQSIFDYLRLRLHCKVTEHRLGFQVVHPTDITEPNHAAIQKFLSGLKLFYRIMRQRGHYSFENPLVTGRAEIASDVREDLVNNHIPRMPDISGVEEPRHWTRLTNNYFVLELEEWIPHIIDDPYLPKRVLEAGYQHNWTLREECVFRILYEAGPRIAEVLGLTLWDWLGQGALREALALNKGSNGKHVKPIRFGDNTAKLLRRYVNKDRSRIIADSYSLDDYLKLAQKHGNTGPLAMPLFLSNRATALTPTNFRQNFWKPACESAGIDVDIHQMRHWYVTTHMRQIYEDYGSDEAELKSRIQSLISYMKWKSGKSTLEAYDHYFDTERHAADQDKLIAKLELQSSTRTQPNLGKDISATTTLDASINDPADHLFNFLSKVGGSRNGR